MVNQSQINEFGYIFLIEILLKKYNNKKIGFIKLIYFSIIGFN